MAFAFQLTLQAPENANIFAKLKREEFVTLRQAIVEMVLATDMSKHFEYLAKFQQAVINRPVDAPVRRYLAVQLTYLCGIYHEF